MVQVSLILMEKLKIFNFIENFSIFFVKNSSNQPTLYIEIINFPRRKLVVQTFYAKFRGSKVFVVNENKTTAAFKVYSLLLFQQIAVVYDNSLNIQILS